MLPNFIKENKYFVEIAGNMYCTRESCDNCEYKSHCENEPESVYVDLVPPVRSVIKTNNTTMDYTLNAENINSSYVNGRFKGNNLPYANKRVYKIVNSIENVNQLDTLSHIIYNKNKYYCVKQLCSQCKHRDQCDNEIEIKEYKDIILVADARAQEPRSFTLSTLITNNLERKWEEVFVNDTIREIGKPYSTFEALFRQHGIDTNSQLFKVWVNKTYFYNKSDLYILQAYCNMYFANKTEDNKFMLENHISYILDKWVSFNTTLKQKGA